MMDTIYDILFITTMPSFYKVNLFNEIAKERKILVVYTGSTEGMRSADFSSVKEDYPCVRLSTKKYRSLIQVTKLLSTYKFKRAIVSGWDNIISFVVVLLHKKSENGCIVESSIQESGTQGIKARLKRFLLNRVSTVYASGTSQRKLVEVLGFNGKIIEFGGCGLLNYIDQPSYQPRERVSKFLYVGRLAEVKNLSLLISAFNELPELELTIIGDGPLRQSLESEAKGNIHFLGAINNKDLPNYYRNVDVFVLPSKRETWGLVVEEALNNGTPVIVSSTVGCAESVVTPFSTGLVFESNNKEALVSVVRKMCNVEFYNKIRKHVSNMDFIERGQQQIHAFISKM